MTNLIKYKEVLYIDEFVVIEKTKANYKEAKNLFVSVILKESMQLLEKAEPTIAQIPPTENNYILAAMRFGKN